MIDDVNQPLLDYEKNLDEDIDKSINQKIRNGFICKVFGIILYQLIITTIVVLFGLFNETFKYLLLKSTALYLICLIASFVLILLPLCYRNVYSSVPQNYIVLTLFTLCFSYLIAAITCVYSPQNVLAVLFLTILIVGALIIYALKTKEDFTVMGGMLCVFLILLIASSLILILIPIPFLYLLYDIAGLIIFSFYIVFDVQLLVGDSSNKFSEDDYILAAMNIYLDVINIFIKLLSLVNRRE